MTPGIKVMKEENLDLTECNHIYNLVDITDSFGVYLNIKKIPYIIIEQYLNFFNPKHMGPHWSIYNELLIKYQVFDVEKNSNISFVSFQEFDFLGKISNLSHIEYKKILNAYDLHDLEGLKGPHNLFLAASNATMRVIMVGSTLVREYFESHINQAYINSNNLYLDYFVPQSNLLVKPHPSNPIAVTDTVISVPGYFPVEFFKAFEGLKINVIYGFNSTSIEKAARILNVNDINVISTDFYRCSFLFLKTYYALKILQMWGMTYIKVSQLYKNFVLTLIKSLELDSGKWNIVNEFDDNEESAVFLNHLTSEECHKIRSHIMSSDKVVYVLISPKEKINFSTYILKDFMRIVKISKEKIRTDATFNLDDEYIWFFSSDKSLLNFLEGYTEVKAVEHLGVQLKIETISTQEMMELLSMYSYKSIKEQEDEEIIYLKEDLVDLNKYIIRLNNRLKGFSLNYTQAISDLEEALGCLGATTVLKEKV